MSIRLGTLILALSLLILIAVGISVWKRSSPKLPPPPKLELPKFEPPKQPSTGIDIIDRALEFGVDSAAVRVGLIRIYFETLEKSKDPESAIKEVIDATFHVTKITDDLRLAEIGHMRTAITNMERELRDYQTDVQKQIEKAKGLTLSEVLALVFAGIQAIAAAVGLAKPNS